MIKYTPGYRWTTLRGLWENLQYTKMWWESFFQRGWRGWADSDTWDIDNYLSQTIPEMLRYFKEDTHSYPGEGTEGAETPEAWDARIDEMIEAFEAARRVIDDNYFETTGFSASHPSPRTLEDWNAASQADQQIFREKAQVFIKYYFHLWD